MAMWWGSEVAYHSASAAVEVREAVLEAILAKDLEAMADADGWVTSPRSGGAISVNDDVSSQYMMVALHSAAALAHAECAAMWAGIPCVEVSHDGA